MQTNILTMNFSQTTILLNMVLCRCVSFHSAVVLLMGTNHMHDTFDGNVLLSSLANCQLIANIAFQMGL